ncbi:hypothetical protein B0H11DRAFT_2224187 [Mycena galericulata]|nr:hypothetical protein B0H11DRAFT_2224187 [Mycena galericulata]
MDQDTIHIGNSLLNVEEEDEDEDDPEAGNTKKPDGSTKPSNDGNQADNTKNPGGNAQPGTAATFVSNIHPVSSLLVLTPLIGSLVVLTSKIADGTYRIINKAHNSYLLAGNPGVNYLYAYNHNSHFPQHQHTWIVKNVANGSQISATGRYVQQQEVVPFAVMSVVTDTVRLIPVTGYDGCFFIACSSNASPPVLRNPLTVAHAGMHHIDECHDTAQMWKFDLL